MVEDCYCHLIYSVHAVTAVVEFSFERAVAR